MSGSFHNRCSRRILQMFITVVLRTIQGCHISANTGKPDIADLVLQIIWTSVWKTWIFWLASMLNARVDSRGRQFGEHLWPATDHGSCLRFEESIPRSLAAALYCAAILLHALYASSNRIFAPKDEKWPWHSEEFRRFLGRAGENVLHDLQYHNLHKIPYQRLYPFAARRRISSTQTLSRRWDLLFNLHKFGARCCWLSQT